MALREGVGLAIVGAVEPKGSGYHITIKGVGPGADGETKFTLEDDAASKADVLQTVGALAAQVRTALGDTVAPVPSDAFTAANLEAVARIREGPGAVRRGQGGRCDSRVPQEATELDPDFGRGYLERGDRGQQHRAS